MRRYLTWSSLYFACSLAAMALIPLALAVVWIARLVTRGQDRADMELLRAAAALQKKQNRRRTQR
jgi:hypothetical protein